MKRAIAALAAIVLVAPGALAQSAGLTGEWSGEGFQVGPGGFQSQWSMRLEFVSRKSVMVEYPSLGCTGELTLLKGDRVQAEYLEKITSGPCIDGGRVFVRRAGGKLMWAWLSDYGADASAVLYPSDLVS